MQRPDGDAYGNAEVVSRVDGDSIVLLEVDSRRDRDADDRNAEYVGDAAEDDLGDNPPRSADGHLSAPADLLVQNNVHDGKDERSPVLVPVRWSERGRETPRGPPADAASASFTATFFIVSTGCPCRVVFRDQDSPVRPVGDAATARLNLSAAQPLKDP